MVTNSKFVRFIDKEMKIYNLKENDRFLVDGKEYMFNGRIDGVYGKCTIVESDAPTDPMHKSATNHDMSAMLKYFGGDYIEYFNRVNSKIIQLTQHHLYKD